MENGFVYEGELKDGMPDGTGKMTYPDGRAEEGEFKDGKFVG